MFWSWPLLAALLVASGRASDTTLDSLESSTLTVAEGATTFVSLAITVTNPDDRVSGGAVAIATNFDALGDTLVYVQGVLPIEGSYSSASGVLTLSGNGTAAEYQTALRSVLFLTVSDAPSAATRTVEFSAGDSAALGRPLAVTPVNDAPEVADLERPALNYTENARAPLTALASVADADDAHLRWLRVAFTGGYEPAEDRLRAAGADFNVTSGALLLNASLTPAQFTAALRNVSYENLSDAPSANATRTLEVVVADAAGAESAPVARQLVVEPVNDAPALATAAAPVAYAETQARSAPLFPDLVIADPDDVWMHGAAASLSPRLAGDVLQLPNGTADLTNHTFANHTLSLAAVASRADYQALLRNITFKTTSADPTAQTRTVELVVSDGRDPSAPVAVALSVQPFFSPPVISHFSGGNSATFVEGDAPTLLAPNLTLSDADSPTLVNATVTLSPAEPGDELQCAFASSPSAGTLLVSGPAALADVAAALRNATFRSTSDAPSAAPRVVTIVVHDGQVASAPATRNLTVVGVNDAPELALPDAQQVREYVEDAAPLPLFERLVVADADGGELRRATVRFEPLVNPLDELAAPGAAYQAASGVLTLDAALSAHQFQMALRNVTFWSAEQNATAAAANRTVSVVVTDPAGANSSAVSRAVYISPVNDAPSVVRLEPAPITAYEGAAAPLSTNLTVFDPDDDLVAAAVVRLHGNRSTDRLLFNGAVYNDTLAISTVQGKDYYQQALRNVSFFVLSHTPSGAAEQERNVTITLTDARGAQGPTAVRRVDVQPVNDAPYLLGLETAHAAYTEGGSIYVSASVRPRDDDDVQLAGASVAIADGADAADSLVFIDTPRISGSYNGGLATLALSGVASLADYQAALRSVIFASASDDPPGPNRTLAFTVVDPAGAESAPVERVVDVTGVNDAPTVSIAAGNVTFAEHGAPVPLFPAAVLADVDNAALRAAAVQCSAACELSGLPDLGTASLADYQAAVRSIAFAGAAGDVSLTVTDAGGLNSSAVTRRVEVSRAPTAAIGDSNETALYQENDAPVAVLGQLVLADADSRNLSWANVSVVNGSATDQLSLARLDGSRSVAEYQALLRAVTFEAPGDAPGAGTRAVVVVVSDGASESLPVRRLVRVAETDDAPVLAFASATPPVFVENGNATLVAADFVLADPDDDSLDALRLTFGGVDAARDDFADLWLNGTAPLADFQQAVRNVTFATRGHDPAPRSRNITITTLPAGNVLTREIRVVPHNDAPALVGCCSDADVRQLGERLFPNVSATDPDDDAAALTWEASVDDPRLGDVLSGADGPNATFWTSNVTEPRVVRLVVRDAAGAVSNALTATVVVPPLQVNYSSTPLTLTLGEFVSFIPAFEGGRPTAYNASVPEGLAVNASTGELAGTPTALAKRATYSVTATNAAGATTAALSLAVVDVPPALLDYAPIEVARLDYAARDPQSNGGGPVVAFAIAPELPAGLSLNATTGRISGAPTIEAAQQQTHTVTATNTGGSATARVNVTVTAIAPAFLNYSTAPAVYEVGEPAAANVPALAGDAPELFTITTGQLPAGLALDNRTGVISGTPEAVAAESTVEIEASNSGGAAALELAVTVLDVPGSVEFWAAQASAQEDAFEAVVYVDRVGGERGRLTVEYYTTDASAGNGTDYELASGTLEWDDGSSLRQSIDVRLVDDDVYEPAAESFFVRLRNVTFEAFATAVGAVGAQSAVEVVVHDDAADEIHLSFTTLARTAAEGDVVWLQVERTGGSGPCSVAYATVAGTATADVDFEATSGALSFDAPGEKQWLSVRVLADGVEETEDESFVVALSSPDNAVVQAAEANVTIAATTVHIQTLAVTAEQGTNATVVVARSGPARDVEVHFETVANGSATAGVDFESVTGVLSLPAAASEASIVVAVLDDGEYEPSSETFGVALSGAVGAALGAHTSATVTIAGPNNAVAGEAHAVYAALDVDEDAGTLALAVSRVGGSDGAASVDWATVAGTATAGEDFVAASGTLSWVDGDSATVHTVNVDIVDDSVYEAGDETFTVELSNAVGVALGAVAATTVTIAGPTDAVPGAIELDAALVAAAEDAGTLELAVSRVGGSDGALSVTWTTVADTATADEDFVAAAGSLSWLDGDSATVHTISVDIVDDLVYEAGNETFAVELSNGARADVVLVGPSDPITLAFGSTQEFTLIEGEVREVTVRRSGGAEGACSVRYSTIAGTASLGSDFITLSNTLSWAADEVDVAKTFTVTTFADDVSEPEAEWFTLRLSQESGALLAASASEVTVFIAEGIVQFAQTEVATTEGVDAVLPLSLVGVAAASTTVQFAVSDGRTPNGTVSASGGNVTVLVPDDDDFDAADRVITVWLFGPSGVALGANATAVVVVGGPNDARVAVVEGDSLAVSELGSTAIATLSLGDVDPGEDEVVTVTCASADEGEAAIESGAESVFDLADHRDRYVVLRGQRDYQNADGDVPVLVECEVASTGPVFASGRRLNFTVTAENAVWPVWDGVVVDGVSVDAESLALSGGEAVELDGSFLYSGPVFVAGVEVRVGAAAVPSADLAIGEDGETLSFPAPAYADAFNGSAYTELTAVSPDGASWSQAVFVFEACAGSQAGCVGAGTCLFGADCEACPSGARCPGGARAWPEAGYWAASESSGALERCRAPFRERCVGWDAAAGVAVCGEGYDQGAVACGACADGYYQHPLTDACEPCPAAASLRELLTPPVVGAVAAAGALLLLRVVAALAGGREARWVAGWLAFVLPLLQPYALLMRSATPSLPGWLLREYEVASLPLLLDPAVLLPEAAEQCDAEVSFQYEYSLLGGALLLTLAKAALSLEVLFERRHEAVRAAYARLALLLRLAYPLVVLTAGRVTYCVDGVLLADSSVVCYEGAHDAVASVAWAALFVVGFADPACTLLHRFARRASADRWLAGHLRPQFYWLDQLDTAFVALLAWLVVTLDEASETQQLWRVVVVSGLCVLLAGHAWRVRPYANGAKLCMRVMLCLVAPYPLAVHYLDYLVSEDVSRAEWVEPVRDYALLGSIAVTTWTVMFSIAAMFVYIEHEVRPSSGKVVGGGAVAMSPLAGLRGGAGESGGQVEIEMPVLAVEGDGEEEIGPPAAPPPASLVHAAAYGALSAIVVSSDEEEKEDGEGEEDDEEEESGSSGESSVGSASVLAPAAVQGPGPAPARRRRRSSHQSSQRRRRRSRAPRESIQVAQPLMDLAALASPSGEASALPEAAGPAPLAALPEAAEPVLDLAALASDPVPLAPLAPLPESGVAVEVLEFPESGDSAAAAAAPVPVPIPASPAVSAEGAQDGAHRHRRRRRSRVPGTPESPEKGRRRRRSRIPGASPAAKPDDGPGPGSPAAQQSEPDDGPGPGSPTAQQSEPDDGPGLGSPAAKQSEPDDGPDDGPAQQSEPDDGPDDGPTQQSEPDDGADDGPAQPSESGEAPEKGRRRRRRRPSRMPEQKPPDEAADQAEQGVMNALAALARADELTERTERRAEEKAAAAEEKAAAAQAATQELAAELGGDFELQANPMLAARPRLQSTKSARSVVPRVRRDRSPTSQGAVMRDEYKGRQLRTRGSVRVPRAKKAAK